MRRKALSWMILCLLPLLTASSALADDIEADPVAPLDETPARLDDAAFRLDVAENPLGLPDEAVQSGGALVIAGGGGLTDGIYDEFIRLAGGASARIVLIPSAYPYRGLPHMRREFSNWLDYHVASFEFLHTDDPQQANTAEFIKPLEEATGVWIGGGTQERLMYRYGGTLVAEAIGRVLARGGVVGGTSAGASVLSEHMIRHGSRSEAVTDQGFGFTTRLIIDQHFSERGRYGRLIGLLEDQTGSIGLGVDENTAVVLEGSRLRVLGKGRASLILPPEQTDGATSVYRLRADETAEAEVVDPAGRQIRFNIQRKTP